jgi:hypothetical protein
MSDTVTTRGVIYVTAAEVRAWGRANGFVPGKRGHLSQKLIDAFNRRHRVRKFTNRNPMARAAVEA